MTAWFSSSALALLLAVAIVGSAGAQTGATAPQEQPPPVEVPEPASPTQPAAPPPTPVPRPVHLTQRVALEVTGGGQPWGTIVIELDQDKAPVTVRNFLRYVDEGFYNGTIFHRVIPGYVIQGGGYTGVNEPKTAGLHEPIANEARNQLKNQRGTIAMARAGEPHSARAQFFINLVDNPKLDYPSRDGWGYCVFGRVVEGMDVVDRIAGVQTQANPEAPGERSQPVEPPLVLRAHRLPVGSAPVSRPANSARRHGRTGVPAPAQPPSRFQAQPAPSPDEPQPTGEEPEESSGSG